MHQLEEMYDFFMRMKGRQINFVIYIKFRSSIFVLFVWPNWYHVWIDETPCPPCYFDCADSMSFADQSTIEPEVIIITKQELAYVI